MPEDDKQPLYTRVEIPGTSGVGGMLLRPSNSNELPAKMFVNWPNRVVKSNSPEDVSRQMFETAPESDEIATGEAHQPFKHINGSQTQLLAVHSDQGVSGRVVKTLTEENKGFTESQYTELTKSLIGLTGEEARAKIQENLSSLKAELLARNEIEEVKRLNVAAQIISESLVMNVVSERYDPVDGAFPIAELGGLFFVKRNGWYLPCILEQRVSGRSSLDTANRIFEQTGGYEAGMNRRRLYHMGNLLLAWANNCGMLERDVINGDTKPDHVLVDYSDGSDEPIVKTIDFGLSRILTAEEYPVNIWETHGLTKIYASADRLIDREVSQLDDIYALSLSLIHVLMGRRIENPEYAIFSNEEPNTVVGLNNLFVNELTERWGLSLLRAKAVKDLLEKGLAPVGPEKFRFDSAALIPGLIGALMLASSYEQALSTEDGEIMETYGVPEAEFFYWLTCLASGKSEGMEVENDEFVVDELKKRLDDSEQSEHFMTLQLLDSFYATIVEQIEESAPESPMGMDFKKVIANLSYAAGYSKKAKSDEYELAKSLVERAKNNGRVPYYVSKSYPNASSPSKIDTGEIDFDTNRVEYSGGTDATPTSEPFSFTTE